MKYIKVQNKANRDVYVNINLINDIEIVENNICIIKVHFHDQLNKYTTTNEETISKLKTYLKNNEL